MVSKYLARPMVSSSSPFTLISAHWSSCERNRLDVRPPSSANYGTPCRTKLWQVSSLSVEFIPLYGEFTPLYGEFTPLYPLSVELTLLYGEFTLLSVEFTSLFGEFTPLYGEKKKCQWEKNAGEILSAQH